MECLAGALNGYYTISSSILCIFYIQIRISESCSAADEDSGFLGCCYSMSTGKWLSDDMVYNSRRTESILVTQFGLPPICNGKQVNKYINK